MLSFAQNTQTIKGRVLDGVTQQPLLSATVFIKNGEDIISSTTDFDGYYKLKSVPVGRVNVQCSYLGYEPYSSGLLTLTSGKELTLDILMQEMVNQTEEVVVTAKKQGLPKNESLQISTKSFSIKETNRFAGSINDPGRVALNSPGVMSNQDNNNDVMIRGNSAVGVLWRLEGIDVPNVNHFSRPGSSGGGITALSPHLMGGSDFSTGAFSAEYGNALAGVFDISYRKGNNERHEFSFKAGMIGLEFGAEGPFKKTSKASYLVNYRYSTLGLLNKIGLNVVSENTENVFQDLAFNINVPTKKKAYINIFGLGGLSSEITYAKKDSAKWEGYSDKLQIDFVTNLGIIGVSWTQLINKKSYVKTVIAGSFNDITDSYDTLSNNIQFHNFKYRAYRDSRIGLNSTYNLRIKAGLNLKAGLEAHQIFYKFKETELNNLTNQTDLLIQGKGTTTLLQPFVQMQYRPTPTTTIVGGVHGLYLALNNSVFAEPRISIKQKIGNRNTLTFAYGLHSQHLPLGSYFTESKTIPNTYPNKDLKLIKNNHFVLGYEVLPINNLKIRVEPYFQYLFHLPISPQAGSTYMMLNDRDGFALDSLVSKGVGMNYGVDINVEKFYSKNWFLNFNATVFKSSYRTIDKKWYATAYDNRFGLALMGGKEFQFKKNNSLELGLRLQYSGGFNYTPIDENASKLANEEVEIDSLAFTQRYKNYFRPDFRIAYKKNQRNFSWTLSLDLANFVNYKNILREFYNKDTGKIDYKYQMGILPILAFNIDFFGKKLVEKEQNAKKRKEKRK